MYYIYFTYYLECVHIYKNMYCIFTILPTLQMSEITIFITTERICPSSAGLDDPATSFHCG